MEVRSPRVASPTAPLESSPSGSLLCSSKHRRVSLSGSPSTNNGSVVTAISGTMDTFQGRSTTAYKNWLQVIQPTAATCQLASNRHKSVAARSSPATGGSASARRASNGAAAPSCLPFSSSLPQPPLFASNASTAAPAPTAGIFAGIHSHPRRPSPHTYKVRFFCIPR